MVPELLPVRPVPLLQAQILHQGEARGWGWEVQASPGRRKVPALGDRVPGWGEKGRKRAR